MESNYEQITCDDDTSTRCDHEKPSHLVETISSGNKFFDDYEPHTPYFPVNTNKSKPQLAEEDPLRLDDENHENLEKNEIEVQNPVAEPGPKAKAIELASTRHKAKIEDRACELGRRQGRRKRKNPFITFFVSMYARRPYRRAADVARQAGRQWRRMSDHKKKKYAADEFYE